MYNIMGLWLKLEELWACKVISILHYKKEKEYSSDTNEDITVWYKKEYSSDTNEDITVWYKKKTAEGEMKDIWRKSYINKKR